MGTPKASVPIVGTTDEPTLEDTRRSPMRVLSRVAIVVVIVGLTAMWGYAFFGKFDVPGRMADRTFPTAAEPVCAQARAAMDRLPKAFQTQGDVAARADVVDQSTAILEAMVTDLRRRVPAGTDHDRISQWLGDWDTFNHDRRAYTAELRRNPNARFLVTQSDRDKAQITKAMDNFAKVNDMPSCMTPEDLF